MSKVSGSTLLAICDANFALPTYLFQLLPFLQLPPSSPSTNSFNIICHPLPDIMVFLMLAPVLCAFVGIGALSWVASLAARDVNGIQRNATLPVMLHFPVEKYVVILYPDLPVAHLQRSLSTYDMSVVDGMSVRLDPERSVPLGYHGAIFENEAKNFSRDGLVTGVGVSQAAVVRCYQEVDMLI